MMTFTLPTMVISWKMNQDLISIKVTSLFSVTLDCLEARVALAQCFEQLVLKLRRLQIEKHVEI